MTNLKKTRKLKADFDFCPWKTSIKRVHLQQEKGPQKKIPSLTPKTLKSQKNLIFLPFGLQPPPTSWQQLQPLPFLFPSHTLLRPALSTVIPPHASLPISSFSVPATISLLSPASALTFLFIFFLFLCPAVTVPHFQISLSFSPTQSQVPFTLLSSSHSCSPHFSSPSSPHGLVSSRATLPFVFSHQAAAFPLFPATISLD